jgi:hypothetical protein
LNFIGINGTQAEACATKSIAPRSVLGDRMEAKIEVEKTGNLEFRVRIIEKASETTHTVTMKQGDYARLTGGKIEPEELVRRSFEFLLEREPKESILGRFDLSVISRYFPDFELELERKIV